MDQARAPDFSDAAAVVADPLHFKAQLGIGENAYALLRVKKAVFEAWDAAGAAATGAAVAASPTVAGTFFGASGFWAALGLGSAAATPVGWIVLAAAVSGGAWFGLSRALKGAGGGQVTVIPHFIRTPMDVLALGLFELMAPLALKVAAVDGPVTERERVAIRAWFTRDWGYDAGFVAQALDYTEARLEAHSIKALAAALAEFKRQNRDCDPGVMGPRVLAFLREVAEADGPMEEREEMAIERIAQIFAQARRFSLGRVWRDLRARVRRGAARGA